MQSLIVVTAEAEDTSLLTLYEARLGLNLGSSSVQILDDQVEMLIGWASDEIAVSCNRVFAKESVVETFHEVSKGNRIYVSHYPIVAIDGLTEKGSALVEGTDFEVDRETGTINRMTKLTWGDPVVVSYTGGYDLPNDAPRPLRQATLLLMREGYYAMLRGDATVRMISHKDSRVIYFDPLAAAKLGMGGGSSGGGTPARRAVNSLLMSYTRILA